MWTLNSCLRIVALLLALLISLPAFVSTAQSRSVSEERLAEIAKDYPLLVSSYRQIRVTVMLALNPELLASLRTKKQARLEELLNSAVFRNCWLEAQLKICPTCESECGNKLPIEGPFDYAGCMTCIEEQNECRNRPQEYVLVCAPTREARAVAPATLSDGDKRRLRTEWTRAARQHPAFAKAYSDLLLDVSLVQRRGGLAAHLAASIEEAWERACLLGAFPTLAELREQCEDCQAGDLGNPVHFQEYLKCRGRQLICLSEAETQPHCPG